MNTSKDSSDTIAKSVFSLKESLDVIHPHLEYLSFKRLEDCVRDFDATVRGQKCSFSMWDGRLLIPISFKGENVMVYPIPVHQYEVGNGQKVKEVHFWRFLLKRTQTDRSYGYWYFQTMKFVLKPHATVHFDLHDSQIKFVDDESLLQFVKRLPDHFYESFWKQIADWISNSEEPSRKRLESLAVMKTSLPIKVEEEQTLLH